MRSRLTGQYQLQALPDQLQCISQIAASQEVAYSLQTFATAANWASIHTKCASSRWRPKPTP